MGRSKKISEPFKDLLKTSCLRFKVLFDHQFKGVKLVTWLGKDK